MHEVNLSCLDTHVWMHVQRNCLFHPLCTQYFKFHFVICELLIKLQKKFKCNKNNKPFQEFIHVLLRLNILKPLTNTLNFLKAYLGLLKAELQFLSHCLSLIAFHTIASKIEAR